MTSKPMNPKVHDLRAVDIVAQEILQAVNFPFELIKNEVRGGAAWAKRAPLILLTLAGIDPKSSLEDAKPWSAPNNRLPNKKWIARYNEWWGKGDVSEGSYDYFLRNGLRQLIATGLAVEDPDILVLRKPNSPAKCYGLSPAAAVLLQAFHIKEKQADAVTTFLIEAGHQQAAYVKAQDGNRLEIAVGKGKTIQVSKDEHNALQKAIVELFLPHFAPDFELVYIGETSNRELIRDAALVEQLGLAALFSDKLPDVVAYDPKRDWIVIVEAYHSSGAISTIRHDQLKQMLGAGAKKTVFVTAFATRVAYKAHANEIAWKTEVWIADNPTHLIHMDGERFLGPYA